MFNPTEILIEAFGERLEVAYWRTYGHLEPRYAGLLAWAGHMALESIANSDALYHDVEHTIMVTLVGQEMLKGKHLREGGVTPRDWLHFVISLLCHDIGYVRGVCRDDNDGAYTTGTERGMITLPPGATDAALTPYHIDRGKRFIRERFGGHQFIDAEVIAANIERTRFPVPDDSDHQGTADYPGLVRAADLIGQLADPHHLRKFPALFYEFAETGTNERLGYKTPADLRDDYPAFYWNVVSRYIQPGLCHLRMTQEGKQWIANLYAHVFTVEHRQP
ncbi:MAG: metal-dependent phosphohydrolase [Candidatus Entotheonella factor]|uniref:Metal-dependent phosphohydrolase n=1 Tax=Entotheonella factor TaxID=1429438 RepID=W4LW42_ENTF1|nr:Npun_R2479 family HD domain-containing metalloprotein [Candidatus Entotheonella palauensis]ETX02123.1 MAG: metal-dependent phosphohydrolase [Candidatus Entotheonella factor]